MSASPRRKTGRDAVARLGVAVGALVLSACAQGTHTVPWEAPEGRGADGLLGDADLQEVVELQVRRDAEGLVVRLGHVRAEVRARSALALGSVQAPDAAPALVAALSDPEASVRRDAAFALGQSGVLETAAALTAGLSREVDASVRLRMVEALGKLAGEGSAEALLAHAAADRQEEAERILALARLGAVGGIVTAALVDTLAGRLADPDPRIRTFAAYFFGRSPEPGAWTGATERVRTALDAYGKDDSAALYLVQGLGRLQAAEDAPRLRERLEDSDDWRLRANAAAASAGVASESATREALLRALDDPSRHVGVSAAQSLGQASPTASVRAGTRVWIAAHPEEWQVAAPLLDLLARAGDEEAVLAWLDAPAGDGEDRIRVGVQALARLGSDTALVRLRGAAASPSAGVSGAALAALAQRWRRDRQDPRTHGLYLEVFRGGLRHASARSASLSAAALADSALLDAGGRGALEEAAASGDPEVRRVAERALATLDGGEGNSGGARPEEEAPDAVDERARLDWGYLGALGPLPRMTLETDRGRVVLRLDAEAAPQTVQTIARFAEAGSYDGVTFHRVVPNFVVQGGDFTRRDGSGGPGFTIRSELNLLRYVRGVIGMASAGKDTEGSQFFITHSMQPHLDGAYTVFGWVTEGMDVVDRIQVGDRIVRAAIERDD